MHADFLHRINVLLAGEDTMCADTLKSELFDLLRYCQVTPKNRFLVSTFCGPLAAEVTDVFGPLALMPVLTQVQRRQVYFAVLAANVVQRHDEREEDAEADRLDLISRFFLCKDKDLVTWAYGSCPPGFLKLIGRFGEYARDVSTYWNLFSLLRKHPQVAQPLLAACQSRELTDDLIYLAQALSPASLGVRAAERFETMEEYDEFMQAYKTITGTSSLSEAHLRRIAEGEVPGNLLEQIYLEFPFPAPVLSAPDLTHIADGRALVRTAVEFANCLADYVAEALRGELQYYVWRRPDAPEVVFAIKNDAPFGWYLSEAKLTKNGRLPSPLRRDLHRILESLGVRTNDCVENIMWGYRKDPHVAPPF